MRNRAIIITLLFVQLIVGCTGSSYVSEILSRAEGLMSEHPDSALQILKSLDRESIKGEKELADYAFLLTKAQYKNYIDAKNDSLIQISVIYYEKQGMKKELSESLLLKGSIETANRSYSDAMLTLQKAAEIGESLGDYYLLGQIYSNLYNICQWGYNADEVSFAEKALEYYRKTGDNYYIIDAQSNLGAAYYRVKEFAKSASLLDSVLTKAVSTADTFSILKAAPTLARIKAVSKDFEVSDSIFAMLQSKYNYRLDYKDLWALAESELAKNNKKEAIELMGSAETKKLSPVSKLIFSSSAGDFYGRIGDYKRAWEYMREALLLKDSISNERFKSTVMTAQRDFVSKKLEVQQIKEARTQILWTAGSLFVIVLLMFVLFFFNRRLRVRTLEMENMMLQISDLKQAATGKDSTIEGLSQKIQKATDETETMKGRINDLYEQKYQQLNNLCISYFNGQNTLHTKNAIYKEVHSIIEGFGKDGKSFRELEEIVNSSRNGILDKLKNDIPNLKSEEYKFFCYVFAGFSSRSISLLMHENVDTVYQHRSRWKKRFESMNIPNKKLYLELI